MRLSVATNWDDRLIEGVEGYPVQDFFGTLQFDPVGGGRPSSILTEISERRKVEEYVEKLHAKGIKFNYIMSGACMGGREYDPQWNKGLFEFLDWLRDFCDYMTVSVPYLAEVIKPRFPEIKLIVSVIARVNSPNQIKLWETLGADIITLDFMINRDFKRLKTLVEAANCELQLILTDGCIPDCPYRIYCYNTLAHLSQDGSVYHGPVYYSLMRCAQEKLSDPRWVIRSPWIRPEDVAEYEKLGIKRFKISGREHSTERILMAVKSYSERRSQGNIMEMLCGALNWGLLGGLADVFFLDGRALDGFIDFFKQGKCSQNCFACSYCDSWAEEAVHTNSELLAYYKTTIAEVLKGLTAGDFEPLMKLNEQVMMLGKVGMPR